MFLLKGELGQTGKRNFDSLLLTRNMCEPHESKKGDDKKKKRKKTIPDQFYPRLRGCSYIQTQKKNLQGRKHC